jgi:hypothetical protein
MKYILKIIIMNKYITPESSILLFDKNNN